MPSRRQYAFFYGVMLPQICSKIGVSSTKSNHEVIKALIKTRFGVDSLRNLDVRLMSHFIEHTAIFFSTEFGIMLDLPGESGVEDMDMKDFLELNKKLNE